MFGRELRQDLWPRLIKLTWNELRTRAQQGISKRLDAAFYRVGVRFEGEAPKKLAHASASFFFLPDTLPELVALLGERLASEVDRIIDEADRICQHRFDLLGYQKLDYGPQIDWHLDPVHQKRAPLRPWFKVRYLDFDEVGDHKVIWELNRHQHLVVLAKAYALTHQERYLAELLRQWYRWHQSNPYPIGINWVSSLEVAFRSLSWLWVRHILAGCPGLPRRFQRDSLRSLALNARHIEKYLSTYFSPNTHLLGEGVGLFFIGTLCSQLPSAERWQGRGWEIIRREAERQVRSDGMHFEQSLYYHVYALDFFFHARALAACNGLPIPDSFDQTLQKMLELLARLGQAGIAPRFGDDDGGRVFNPRRNLAEHMLDPLALGAGIFGRGEFKAAGHGLTEEAIWLLGPEGVARFDALPPEPLSLRSTRYEASGLYLMAGLEPEPHQLVIDAGPQGAQSAGHGHADALSLQLSVRGREWLVDPGTLCYISKGEERDRFRGTGRHNTLEVDDASQAEATGPFSWRLLPNVRVERWLTGETFDLFEGSHSGYSRLREPVTHRRWVFNLKSRFWLVRDSAEGAGEHQLALNWHLASGFEPSGLGHNATLLEGGEGAHLAFLPVQGGKWLREVRRSHVSPIYGQLQPAIVLRFAVRTALPAEFAVVLLPLVTSVRELKDVGALIRLDDRTQEGGVHGYCYRAGEERHYIFFAGVNRLWKLGKWESDAHFLYCGVKSKGGQQWVLCGGSYAGVGGRRMLSFPQHADCYEWTGEEASTGMFCLDEAANELSEEGLTSAQTVTLGRESASSPRGNS